MLAGHGWLVKVSRSGGQLGCASIFRQAREKINWICSSQLILMKSSRISWLIVWLSTTPVRHTEPELGGLPMETYGLYHDIKDANNLPLLSFQPHIDVPTCPLFTIICTLETRCHAINVFNVRRCLAPLWSGENTSL